MSDHLEACRAGSLFGFNDFNGLDLERFGGQVGSLRGFYSAVDTLILDWDVSVTAQIGICNAPDHHQRMHVRIALIA